MITIKRPTLPHSPFLLKEDRNTPPTGKPEKRFRSHFPLADSATTPAEFAVPSDTKTSFLRYESTAKKRSLKIPHMRLSLPYPPFVLSEGSGCTPSQLPYPPFVLSEGRGITAMPQCGTKLIRFHSSATPKLSRINASVVPLHGYATVLARDYNGNATGFVRECAGNRQSSATGIPFSGLMGRSNWPATSPDPHR